MKVNRFFVKEELSGKKEISIVDEDLIHQWLKVFRFKVGIRVVLFDNSGFDYLSEVTLASKKEVNFKIIESKKNEILPKVEVSLFFVVVKNRNNFEWVIEKGTELGVTNFFPVWSDRGESKNVNTERTEKIIKESAEQSGRAKLPALHPIQNLEDAINSNSKNSTIVFHGGSDCVDWNDFSKTIDKKNSINIFIGPEGGWSENEITFFKSKSLPLVSIGSATLRAETAAVVACALFLT